MLAPMPVAMAGQVVRLQGGWATPNSFVITRSWRWRVRMLVLCWIRRGVAAQTSGHVLHIVYTLRAAPASSCLNMHELLIDMAQPKNGVHDSSGALAIV